MEKVYGVQIRELLKFWAVKDILKEISSHNNLWRNTWLQEHPYSFNYHPYIEIYKGNTINYRTQW